MKQILALKVVPAMLTETGNNKIWIYGMVCANIYIYIFWFGEMDSKELILMKNKRKLSHFSSL